MCTEAYLIEQLINYQKVKIMKYNTIQKGVVSGMLALALITTAFPAPRAEAATLEELQAQIQVLLAQLNTLKGLPNGANACTTFFVDLTLGSSGSNVTQLQTFLISKGYSIPAGATGYFGGQTQAALAMYQSNNGIVPASGYFGPITRAKVHSQCAIIAPTPPGGNSGGGNTSGGGSPALGGEASLERFDVKSGDDTNLEEKQKDASVMDVTFNVEDGDVRINRVDLGFTPDNGNNEMDPWDTFKEVTVWNGKERIARIDSSNKQNWEKNTPTSGDYRLRMSGLKLILKEGTKAELTVKVTTESNIKGANDGEVWSLFVPANGIRGLDADNASVFTGDSADSVTISIDEAGSEDGIVIKRSDQDPDSTTLELDSSKRSGWVTVFAFDIDTKDSTNDIEINKIPVHFTVSSSTVDTFMRDARITIDGKTYTDFSVVDGMTNTITFDFDGGELVIDGDDRVIAVVEIDFKPLPLAFEGTTIKGSIDSAEVDAEGADDLTGSQLSGSATGETHTMRTSGAILKSKGTSSESKLNSNTTQEDDEGTFVIKFDVTAFDKDLFIAKSADRGTTLGTGGVNFLIEDTSLGGDEVASGTVASTLASTAKTENGYFKVSEGETKSFTLLVEYDPEYKSFFNVQLYSLNWSATASLPTEMQRSLPEQNYETAPLSINN